jgi:rod shape-determining protein MreD
MRPIGGFLLLACVTLLLRSTAFSSLATRGVVVDALAFATVVWALRHGDSWGSTFGFTLGLVADLDAAHWLGRNALVLALIGYAIGRLSTTLMRESARTQFVLIACATFVHQAWSESFELGSGLVAAPWLLTHALISTGVTALAGTLLLIVLRVFAAGRPLFGHASRTAARS